MIDRFEGQYAFLSNFYPCIIRDEGHLYSTSEHLFQARKCVLSLDKEQFTVSGGLTAGQAKRLGRKVPIKSGWDNIKLVVMEQVLYQKFTQHPELKELLLATGDEELVEGNNWGDTYWGKVDGKGENHLGIELMTLRTRLRLECK